MPALLRARAQTDPQSPALWALAAAGGGWQALTWQQFLDAVAHAAPGLRALGLRRGERVGLIAHSSPQWDIAQLAVLAAGGVVVGLDPHDTPQRLALMVRRAALVGVVAHDETLLARLDAAGGPALRFALTLVAPAAGSRTMAFAGLAGAGRARTASADADASRPEDGDWDASRPDDEALVVYTSGTTGEPKGIAYSHRQVCTAVAAILQTFPDIGAGSRLLCWLPLSNLFQRMINFCALGRGAQTYYIDDPRTLMDHVAAVSPHLLIGVPRFYEKLHAGIEAAIDAKPAWQRALARWAIRAGERRAQARRGGARLGPGAWLAAALAERLVLARVRAVLGRDLRFLISGSAPMPAWLLGRLHGLGWLVLEAYGLSECIVPVAANTPRRYRFGSVGQPLPGVELRLAPDGELQLRGTGVFGGYLGECGAADRRDGADRFDAEGFLASGDYAQIDADGFVTLVGRKSELFKTSTGRRIAPALVESELRRLPYVEHAVVVGAGRPFLVAVLAVAEPALHERLAAAPAAAGEPHWAVVLRADLAQVLAGLPDYQRPAGAVLSTRGFSVAEGLVTPNLKVRRAAIEQAHAADIDALVDRLAQGRGAALAVERGPGGTRLLSI